ncbi:MAG: hypothetical protein EXS35_09780 [Pedosphaera sp.]|nr:hypothetical protein [Pedosphaera sp.]
MPTTKDVRGECQQCGGQFDFAAEAAGLLADCPHCGQQTELLLATPPEEKSPAQTKAIIYTVVAVVILVGGLIGAIIALKRAQRIVGPAQTKATTPSSPKPADPFAAQNFRTGAVTLEKTPGSKLVYAQGSIVNTAKQQRFGVKVELDLFDDAGKWIANASDYTGVLEPGGEWKFHAPVVESKSASAKIAAIKETK